MAAEFRAVALDIASPQKSPYRYDVSTVMYIRLSLCSVETANQYISIKLCHSRRRDAKDVGSLSPTPILSAFRLRCDRDMIVSQTFTNDQIEQRTDHCRFMSANRELDDRDSVSPWASFRTTCDPIHVITNLRRSCTNRPSTRKEVKSRFTSNTFGIVSSSWTRNGGNAHAESNLWQFT
jgi:hypothetical protein